MSREEMFYPAWAIDPATGEVFDLTTTRRIVSESGERLRRDLLTKSNDLYMDACARALSARQFAEEFAAEATAARQILGDLCVEVTEKFGRSALSSPAGQRALTFLAGEE